MGSSIVDLIEVQANNAPDAVAVVAGDRALTYRELDLRANRLAHHLRSLGVGPEIRVGLCMNRSVDLVSAALGVLKAGGAYVPLDPSYPPSRLASLLYDSGAPVVVTHPCVAKDLPAGKWQTVVLEACEQYAAGHPSTSPAVENRPDSLAYVIFTSGSTGQPKGVQITHANLLNLVRWHQNAFNVTPTDRATLQASPGFDAAVWEIWPYLAAGASVYVVDEVVRKSPEDLRDWLVTHGITIGFLPTMLAESVMDLDWPAESKLRILLTGADALHRFPPSSLPFELVNNYGPTECTVVATSGPVPAGRGGDAPPTIGKPIDNTRVYIVNEQLEKVAEGTPGELLIGGAGVGRGYLNRPDLTAEKFIPDSLGGDPTARLYRTGDLVRRLPDGQIAFLGRLDEQLKIRGYRIEPQEVSAVLDRHRDVKMSVVAGRPDTSGERSLVAYIVALDGCNPKAPELRDFLAERLPDYMVPSTFVLLQQMPVSVHGKVDRAALPDPDAENTLALEDEAFEAPQSPIEERVAEILAVVLGRPRISRDQNFFIMGGHSLLGAQTIGRIRDAFDVDIQLRTLFDDPTVRGLSAEIERLILEKLETMSEEDAQRMLASAEEGISI